MTLSPDASTLYGMTLQGGAYGYANGGGGYGTIFSIPVGGGTPTMLYSFDGTNGKYPVGSLTLSGSTLFGMTNQGGFDDYGTIFSIPVGGGTPMVLASFNGTNGANPWGDLTLIGSTLYGMAESGGTYGVGTIFSLLASGGTPTVLASFDRTTNGADPLGDLTLSPDRSTFYGMTETGGAYGYANGPNGYGTIFSIPVGGGPLTTLLSFNGTNGKLPHGSLTLSPDGRTLYGMATSGGDYGFGTIFSLTIPEPSTFALLGIGSAVFLAWGWWRRRGK